jgi:hypothetical protein
VDIKQRGVNRIGCSRLQQQLAVMGIDRRFVARQETSADPSSRCPKRQYCGEAASIGDPTSGYDWDRIDRVDNEGNERKRSYDAAHMASGFDALSDDDVDAGIHRASRLLGVADRLQDHAASFVNDGT